MRIENTITPFIARVPQVSPVWDVAVVPL